MLISGGIMVVAAPRTKVIVNPAANKGRCGTMWPQIKSRLEAAIGPVDAIHTRARGDGLRLARAAFEDGCRRFLAVGGDGTFNEVLNGLMVDDHLIADDLVLAQIPAGTSNAVSVNLGHAGRGPSATAAFAALAAGTTRPVDVFRADGVGADGRPVLRYGVLLATLGAPVTIGLRAGAVPLLKRLGSTAYVLTAIATALTYRPCAVRIGRDGGSPIEGQMWGVMICSAASAGDGLLVAPGARSDDGLLDLVGIGALTRWEALAQIIPRLADGSYIRHPKVSRGLVRDVVVETTGLSPVDVDGEPFGYGPLRVRALAQQVRIAAVA